MKNFPQALDILGAKEIVTCNVHAAGLRHPQSPGIPV